MYEKLLESKIKPLHYLINRLVERDIQLNIPKFCFFLGAGCSKESNIPLGSEIISICQKLAFVDGHKDGYQVERNNRKNFREYMDSIEDFATKNNRDFQKFVLNKEEIFKQSINEDYVLSKLPLNILTTKSDKNKIDDRTRKSDLFKAFHEKIVKDSLYGKWFEEFSQDPRERQKLIEILIDQQNTDLDYIIFCSLIDEGLIHNVFTTNFDDLINENLLTFFDKKARVYSHNELANYISISSDKPNIIKLHGDYLFENVKNIGEETSALAQNMKTKFAETLKLLDLVIIGYNGADHSIMSVLESIKNERSFLLIWCGTSIDKLHWRVVNLINNTQNSYFIEIPSFKELVTKLRHRFSWESFMSNIIEKSTRRQNKLDLLIQNSQLYIEQNESITNEEKELVRSNLYRSALSAVMSRNLSHNMGSHVLSRLAKSSTIDQLDSESIARFNSYLRSRMDLIADISSNHYRYSTHMKLKDELLGEFISQSSNTPQQNVLLNLISGLPELTSKNINITIDEVSEYEEDVLVKIPNGHLGVIAFYIILENIIRNSVKHSKIDSNRGLKYKVSFSKLKKGRDVVKLQIKDNLGSLNKSQRSHETFLQNILRLANEPIINKNKLRNIGWGIAEIKIVAAYLRQISIDAIDDKIFELPILEIKLDSQFNLAFIFYLNFIPIKIGIIINEKQFSHLFGKDNNFKDIISRLKKIGVDIIEEQAIDSNNKINSYKFILLFESAIIPAKLRNTLRIIYCSKENQKLKELINDKESGLENILLEIWKIRLKHLTKNNIPKLRILKDKERILEHSNGKAQIIFDNHGRNFKDFSSDSLFYEAYFAHSYIEKKLNEESDLTNCEIIESCLIRVGILDERIQKQINQNILRLNKNENISYGDILLLQNIFIPNSKEIDLSSINVSNLFDILKTWIVNSDLDFIIINLGLVEKLVDIKSGDIKEFISKIESLRDFQSQSLKVILTSGRGIPNYVPVDAAFIHFSHLSNFLFEQRNKYQLIQTLYSLSMNSLPENELYFNR